MAGPSAGAILADLGADVIKVEPLSGDPMRNTARPAKVEGSLKGYDFCFDVDNRGKRSIAVDLTSDEGADLVRSLCAEAQIFLCNLLPQRQQRFGLDPETLAKANPQLVHATITGYGSGGPESWRPGFDVTAFFGRSGLYDAMREGAEGIVPNARPAQGDHATGLALVSGILSALRLAERTGTGQVVETSLFEAAVWTQASDYGITAADRAPVRRRARHEMIVPTANRYPCGDGSWVVFNMPEEAAWERMCRCIGTEHLLDDPRLQTIRDRFHNMAELVDAIDEALSARSRDEWGPIFDKHELIWGPALALHEVVDDPQAEAIGLFPTIEHPEHGDYRSVRVPMRIEGAAIGPKGPAPAVGQHTAEVLGDAGLSDDAIQQLLDDGTIA